MRGGMGLFPARDVFRDGTFSGTGRFPGWDVFRDGTFSGMGRFPGWDVFRDGTSNGMYISHIYHVPFTWKECLPGRFSSRPGKRDF